MASPQFRTLLEQLVRTSNRTIEETCAAYEDTARRMREPATLSPRQLWRWMTGEVDQPRPVAQRVAEAFWGQPFTALLAPPPTGDGRPGSQITGPMSADRGPSDVAAIAEYEVGDPTDRRHAIQTLGTAAIGAGIGLDGLFAQSAADAMEFTRRAEASDLGARTLDHLELVVAGMASAFAYTPPAQMFRTAQTYRHQVARLIDGRQTLRQRRELYRYAGWLSIILGWLSHDLGDPLAAEAHCVDAWEHGWQADDGEICGWAMDTAATIAMYTDQPERARQAAERGLAAAPTSSAASVRLACQLTRTHGRLRQPQQFDQALADTRRQLDQLPQQGSGLFSADAGRIASYAATASIWLDRPDQAVVYAREALDFYASSALGQRSPTREAISRLDLALALTAMKSPDGAAEQATRALESERVTGTVLARAREVDAGLQRSYPRLPAAREVHDRYLDAVRRQGGAPQVSGPSTGPATPPAAGPGWPR